MPYGTFHLTSRDIALILVESIRGRELDQRTNEWILLVGLVMIVAIMVVVIYMDFLKSFEG